MAGKRARRPKSGAPDDAFGPCLVPNAPLPTEAVDLAPSQPGFVVTVPGLLSEAECAAIVAAADSFGWDPATAADRAPRKNMAYLDRDALVFRSPALEAELWRRLLPHLPPIEARVPVGLRADGVRGEAGQCRLYRYTAGQRFDRHYDVSRKGPRAGEETEFTLLVYLSSQGELPPSSGASACAGGAAEARALVGGDTVFWASARKELCRASPRAGMALLHAHGRRCLLHEAELVERGAKFVLRADVLYGPAPAEPAAGRPARDGMD